MNLIFSLSVASKISGLSFGIFLQISGNVGSVLGKITGGTLAWLPGKENNFFVLYFVLNFLFHLHVQMMDVEIKKYQFHAKNWLLLLKTDCCKHTFPHICRA